VTGLVRALLALVGLILSAQVVVRLARYLLASRAASTDNPALTTAAPRHTGFLRRLPLEPGMRVLHIGPADAGLVRGVAHRVGKYGKVYVVESTTDRAEQRAGQLRAGRIGNVEVLSGDPARLELPDSTFDVVLCVRALATQPRRQRALWELQRVLRPSGQLAVSESLRPGSFLPRLTLKTEADAVGLECREEHGSPLAYTATFRKLA
jgi:ubiquinone/menaquinone biosynthesis C-methylase UbiE